MAEDVTCFVCGAPAVELHHCLVPQYKRYGAWAHNPVNLLATCRNCHQGTGEAKSYAVKLRWIAEQDKTELIAWLDAAPAEAWTRVAEIRRMAEW